MQLAHTSVRYHHQTTFTGQGIRIRELSSVSFISEMSLLDPQTHPVGGGRELGFEDLALLIDAGRADHALQL